MKSNRETVVKAALPFLSAILICLTLIIGCGEIEKRESTSYPTLNIGVVIPTEGSLWLLGREFLKGLNMAVAECNDNGGVKGHQIDLIVINNGGDPLVTAESVKRLAGDSTVIAVLGPIISNNALAAGAVAQHEKLPMILPLSTNPAVTEIGDYISRICFTDVFQARTLARYSFNSLGIKKTAILFERNNSYSEGLAGLFEREFTELGGEICIEESYSDGDKTFLPFLQKIFVSDPDAIFLPGYYPEAALLIQEVVTMGEHITFLGGDGWESLDKLELPEEVLHDEYPIYITSHFSPENILPTTQHFVQNYENKFNSSPNALSALAYDAGMLVFDALRRANRLSRDALREAINETRDFSGATGRIGINEKRNAVKPVYLVEMRGGKFHLRASDVPAP